MATSPGGSREGEKKNKFFSIGGRLSKQHGAVSFCLAKD